MAILSTDRLFPMEPTARSIARDLYGAVRDLPIISPHGHTDPSWFALNTRFPNPAELFVIPDHYVFRMLVSQGVSLQDLGVPRRDGGAVETDPRKIWSLFAQHFYLFRATPSAMWIEHSFQDLFGLDQPFGPDTADAFYDVIDAKLAEPEFTPRALYERFNIEVLATTESALDGLAYHQMIRDSDWRGRVITTYRPDAVVDPDFEGFSENITALGVLTGEDTTTWQGYLNAHRARRGFFKSMGATATDHGHPSARTENYGDADADALFQKVRRHLFGAGCGCVPRADADRNGPDEP